MGYLALIAFVLYGLAAAFWAAHWVLGAIVGAGAVFFAVGAIAVGVQSAQEWISKLGRSWPSRASKRYKYWIR